MTFSDLMLKKVVFILEVVASNFDSKNTLKHGNIILNDR